MVTVEWWRPQYIVTFVVPGFMPSMAVYDELRMVGLLVGKYVV
jgi:hypothetical protein